MENSVTQANKDTFDIQALLDIHCEASNIVYRKTDAELGKKILDLVIPMIEAKRGPAPICYGEDDCSTLILSMCPWRMTCGKD